MRRIAPRSALAALALLDIACERTGTRTTSTDTASRGAAVAPDTSADARAASLSDTLLPLAPAPRAPRMLAVDSAVKAATLVGTDQVATPLCATGLKDPATGVTLRIVRSVQNTFRPLGSADSTTWGRADYRPSEPSRFGLGPHQVLRVDCVTRRVLGIAPDIGTASPGTRI